MGREECSQEPARSRDGQMAGGGAWKHSRCGACGSLLAYFGTVAEAASAVGTQGACGRVHMRHGRAEFVVQGRHGWYACGPLQPRQRARAYAWVHARTSSRDCGSGSGLLLTMLSNGAVAR